MDKKSILIIDDDKAILKSFKSILELKGFRVSTAENGREALEKVCSDFFNLALIDIRLPDTDGTSLLQEFQQIVPTMKKVMITGYSTEENAIDALNLGADGYLRKPVMPGRLLKFLSDKLAEQESENMIYEDIVNDLIRTRSRDLRNSERWA
jgi:two-component system NtrC family response regulator